MREVTQEVIFRTSDRKKNPCRSQVVLRQRWMPARSRINQNQALFVSCFPVIHRAYTYIHIHSYNILCNVLRSEIGFYFAVASRHSHFYVSETLPYKSMRDKTGLRELLRNQAWGVWFPHVSPLSTVHTYRSNADLQAPSHRQFAFLSGELIKPVRPKDL